LRCHVAAVRAVAFGERVDRSGGQSILSRRSFPPAQPAAGRCSLTLHHGLRRANLRRPTVPADAEIPARVIL
ncbi:MAG TPA: hypothetical protein VFE27_01625, partial [Acidobacteriaceae bacterium]|nr:hypothetical protein [Acidobacteriaceae bacterium]